MSNWKPEAVNNGKHMILNIKCKWLTKGLVPDAMCSIERSFGSEFCGICLDCPRNDHENKTLSFLAT